MMSRISLESMCQSLNTVEEPNFIEEGAKCRRNVYKLSEQDSLDLKYDLRTALIEFGKS